MQTMWLGENRDWGETADTDGGRVVDLANGWTGHVYGTGPVKEENRQGSPGEGETPQRECGGSAVDPRGSGWEACYAGVDSKPTYTDGQFKGKEVTGEKKEKVERICVVEAGKVREGGAKEDKQFVSEAYSHFSQGDDLWSSKELLHQPSTEQEDTSTTQEGGTRHGSGGDIVLNHSFEASKVGLPGVDLHTGLSYSQQGVRKEMIDRQTSHEHSSLTGPPSSCFPRSPLKPPCSSIATPSTTCPGVPSLSSSPPLFSSAILPPAFETASFPPYHASPQISLTPTGCFYPQSEGGLPCVGGIPASNSSMYYLPPEAHSVTSDDGSVFPSHLAGGENGCYMATQPSPATGDCSSSSFLASGPSVLLTRESPSVSALSRARESSVAEKRSGGAFSRKSSNAESSSSNTRLRWAGNPAPSVISSLCETKTHTPLQSTRQKRRTGSTEKRKRVRRSRTRALNAEASSCSSSVQSWGVPGGTSASFSLSPSSSFSSNPPPLPSVSGIAEAAFPPGSTRASSFLSTSQSTILQGAHVAECAVSASFSQRKPFEEVLSQAHRCLDREKSDATEVTNGIIPGCKLLQQTDNSLSQLGDPFGGLPLSSPDGRIVVLLHPVESHHPLLQPRTNGGASGLSSQVSTWEEGGSLYGDITRDSRPGDGPPHYGVQHHEGVVSQGLSVLPSPYVDERKDFFGDGFVPNQLSRQREVSRQEEASHHAATSSIPNPGDLPQYRPSMGESKNVHQRGGGEGSTVCEQRERGDKEPEHQQEIQEKNRDQTISSYTVPLASGEQGSLPLYFYNPAQQQPQAYNVYAMSPYSVEMMKDYKTHHYHDLNPQMAWNTNGSCVGGERSVPGFIPPPQGIPANGGTAPREERMWAGPYSRYQHQSSMWGLRQGGDDLRTRKETGGAEVPNASSPPCDASWAFFPPPQHQTFGLLEGGQICEERQKELWRKTCNDAVMTPGHLRQGPVLSGVVFSGVERPGESQPVSCEGRGGWTSSLSSLPTLSEGEGGGLVQGYPCDEGERKKTAWTKVARASKNKNNSRKYGGAPHQEDSTDASLSRNGQEEFEGLPKAPPLDVSVSPSFLLSDNDEVSCAPPSSSKTRDDDSVFLHPRRARDLLGERDSQGDIIFHAYGVTPDMNCPLPVCFSLPQQLCDTVMNGPSASCQTEAQERESLLASRGGGGESAATMPGETRHGPGVSSSWASDGSPQESFGRECKEEDDDEEEGRAKKGEQQSEGGEGLLSSGEAEWIRERTTYFQEDDEETTFSELEGLGLLTRPKGGRVKRFNVGKKPYSGVRGIYFQQGAWKVRYRGNAEEVVRLFPYTHGDLRSMSKQFKLARQFLRQVIAKGRQLHDSDGEGLSEDEPAWLTKRRAATSNSSSRGIEPTASRLRRHYHESFPYMPRHSRGVRGTIGSHPSVLRERSRSPYDSSSFQAGRYSRRATRRTHFLSSPPSDTSSRPLTPKDYAAPPSRVASSPGGGGEEEDDWEGSEEGDFFSCGDGQNPSLSQSSGLFGLKWVSSRHERRRKGSKGKRSTTTSHRRQYGESPYFGDEATGVIYGSPSSSHVKGGGRRFAGDAFGREGRPYRGFHDGGRGVGIQEVYVHPSMEYRMMMTKPISGATFFKPVFFPPLFGPESEPWGLRADRILDEVNSLEEKRNAVINAMQNEQGPAERTEGGQEDIHAKVQVNQRDTDPASEKEGKRKEEQEGENAGREHTHHGKETMAGEGPPAQPGSLGGISGETKVLETGKITPDDEYKKKELTGGVFNCQGDPSYGGGGRGGDTEGSRTGKDVKENENAPECHSLGGENVIRQNDGREDQQQAVEGQGEGGEKKERHLDVKSLLVDNKREDDDKTLMRDIMVLSMPALHVQKADVKTNDQSSLAFSSSSLSLSSETQRTSTSTGDTRPLEESGSLRVDAKREERKKRPADWGEDDEEREKQIGLTETEREMKRRKIDVQNGQGFKEDGVTILTQNGSSDVRARELEGEDTQRVLSTSKEGGGIEGQEEGVKVMGEGRSFMTEESSHVVPLDTPNRRDDLSFSERFHPSCIVPCSFPSTTPSFATSSSSSSSSALSRLLPVESSSRPPSFAFEERPSSRLPASPRSMCAPPPRHRSTAAERRARRDQFGRFLPGGGSSSPARRTSPKRSTATPGGGGLLLPSASFSSSNSCSSFSMTSNSFSSNTSIPSHARVSSSSSSHRHSSLLASQSHQPIDPERQSAYRLVSSYPWDFLFDSRVPGRSREGGGAEHGIVPLRRHPSSPLFFHQQGKS